MAFNIGLSGLRASQVDLDVTGNNIANASTVGFKGSEAQFGDLYASGFLSSGSNPVGDGVRVQDVEQQFGQGNIRFTDNGLDMAINGDGFFVLNNGGEVRYSRAGQFGIDKNGFVTNNQGMRVQGFQADNEGNLSGVRGDLQIDNSNLAPQRTTNVDSDLNLDSRQSVLAESGSRYPIEDSSGTIYQPALNTTTNAQQLTVTYPDNTTRSVDVAAGDSARSIANALSQEEDVSATGRTTSILDGANDGSVQGGDILTLQGLDFTVQSTDENSNPLDQAQRLQRLADDINGSSLSGLNAAINNNGDMRIISSRGDTLEFSFDNSGGNSGGSGGGSLEFNDGTTINTTTQQQFGGVNITLGRDVSLASTPDTTGDDTVLTGRTPEGFTTNTFDPTDQRTYNHATSSTIYDSLGNPHTMTKYFVKEPSTGANQGSPWSMYAQIDGRNIGDPTAPGGQPSMAKYDLLFNEGGTLESVDGSPENEILVSNWVPVDENGQPNGADGPRTVADGGQVPIPDPPVSSNFTIDLNDTTQYGSEFAVNDQQQNGFTTGRLSGIDVSNEGILFARYSNGQSQTLGQVSLANFNNTEGLAPVGETTWVETFESGQPIIGSPDSGTLGAIKASSVEESNVDLSGELVNLIIAQRNYQANAKTIETADSVTQTIINLR